MQFTQAIAVAVLSYVAVAAPLGSSDCKNKDNACRTAPDANMAQCSAEHAQCLGYNPYTKRAEAPHSETGDAVYFPAKDAKRTEAPHWETGDAVYFPAPKDAKRTEEPHWETGDAVYFPAKDSKRTDAPHWETGDAVYFPAPKDSKRTEEPHWETGDAVYFPAPSKRAEDCKAKDDACRTAPDANMSFCSSENAKCLGYNPY
ncbi:hypothetical protein PG996_013044 [Apiospora saccharicola]|uniref:Uncharacterized protein n=1 Tax=Apiospora saccharicola TaxID=335842 RepID=A0ABR1U4B6_9PEZI